MYVDYTLRKKEKKSNGKIVFFGLIINYYFQNYVNGELVDRKIYIANRDSKLIKFSW
mgnify:CR=1 FL=1